MTDLKPGLTGSATLIVREEHTAPHVGSGRAPVLAHSQSRATRLKVVI